MQCFILIFMLLRLGDNCVYLSVTCNATKTRADKQISGFLNLEET